MSDIFSHQTEIEHLLDNASPQLIYPRPAFLNFLSDAVDGELRAIYHYENGCLVGFLPFFRWEKDEGVVINSLPWFGSHGGCYVHNTVNPHAVRRSLLHQLNIMLREEKNLITATLSLSPFEQKYQVLYKEELQPDFVENRLGQIVLLPDVQSISQEDISKTLMERMEQKARNSLRKGLRQNFTYSIDSSESAWNFLYEVHCQNMQAIGGTPKTKKHLMALRKHLSDSSRIFIAQLEGDNVAAMLCLYHKPCIEYFLPAIVHAYRPLQPLSFLIHTAMVNACEQNYQNWNFGGTWHSQRSLYHFKRGWGAEDSSYSYLIIRGCNFTKHIQEISKKFPFYYIYPFSENTTGYE
jgi:Uncharacterized protein involved in methicillin resistance